MTSLRDFQIISKLGEGAYSSVYKAKRLSDGQEYAFKKVKLQNLSEKEKQNALNEVRILASVKHLNMIAYKEAFIDESSNSLCIIMEYANNGDLFQKICEHQKKKSYFSEPEIWNIFIQITKALKALHDTHILHRDLKSANVFLNKDSSVKLGDLNVSKVAKKGLLYTQTGTPYYASPEVWRDMPYDNKSDIWSLGCVLYEMTTLKPPFRAEDMEGLYKKVLRGYYPQIPTHYSQDLSNVIRALLQVSPHLRPSCDKILQLPGIIKRMEEKHFTEIDEAFQNQLLTTIRVPKNLHYLSDKLPKANYSPLKTKKVDRTKFLQTLAGYKETSADNSVLNEVVRGSESVDSYKKDKDGRIYLPPVGKEKEALKIKRPQEKDRKEQLKGNGARVSAHAVDSSYENLDIDAANIKKVVEARKKGKELDEENDTTQRGRAVASGRKVPGNVVANKIAYKVHDLNQDAIFDNNVSGKKTLHGERSAPKIAAADILSGKDPVHSMAKKHREQLLNRSPTNDDASYSLGHAKSSKLPQISQLSPDKYGKLPALNADRGGYESYGSAKKDKIKDISKIYKVNLGNSDEYVEKNTLGVKAPKKERPHNGRSVVGAINSIENGVNGVKYGKNHDRY